MAPLATAAGPLTVPTAHGEVLVYGPDVTVPAASTTGPTGAGDGRVVGVADDRRGGLWVGHADGSVEAVQGATSHGDMAGIPLTRPVVGMAATPTGAGYWLVADDGGIFSFGDARFFGSTGAIRLNRPIVGMAPTPSGAGYWLVASDGGVFAFGDAQFYGSTGAIRLNRPIVGIATTPTGAGYWIVADDGGIFAFGDAHFAGAGTGVAASAVVGLAPSGDGGYWIATVGGAVHAFGGAQDFGSAVGTADVGATRSVASIGARAGGGYYLAVDDVDAPASSAERFVAALPPWQVAIWDALAGCESDGNWDLDTGNGYYGGLQFAQRSWEAVGGTGRPNAASREEQIMRAQMLLDLVSDYGPWPGCARQLDLPR